MHVHSCHVCMDHRKFPSVEASLIEETMAKKATGKTVFHAISKKDTTVKTKYITCNIGQRVNDVDIGILKEWHRVASGTYLNETDPPENTDKREVRCSDKVLNFNSYWMKVKASITKSERKYK